MLEVQSRNRIAMENENGDFNEKDNLDEQNDVDEKNEVDENLKHLMAQACSASQGSRQRNRCLTQVVEIVQKSNRLHHYSSPYYPEAQQETWSYVLGKPENYNSNRGEVIPWINSTLHYRLINEINRNRNPPRIFTSAESYYNLLENIPDSPEVPPIIEETLNWINTDPTKILRQTHLRNRPDVNAQLLLLERFPPETKWDVLTEKLKVHRSTLHKFYKEKCLPLLRGFGEDQGYL